MSSKRQHVSKYNMPQQTDEDRNFTDSILEQASYSHLKVKKELDEWDYLHTHSSGHIYLTCHQLFFALSCDAHVSGHLCT